MSRPAVATLMAALLAVSSCTPKGAPQQKVEDYESRLRENVGQLALSRDQEAMVEEILKAARVEAGSMASEATKARRWRQARRDVIADVLDAEQAERLSEALDIPDYGRIVAETDAMLPRIRAHAEALAALGPRQTGQDGARRAMEYVRAALAEATDGLDPTPQIEEFDSEVTVALDRVGADALDVADEPYSHLIVEGLDDGIQRWPAYSFVPNCVQTCATHPADKCPLADQAGAPCPSCQQPRALVDLAGGAWDDLNGKDLTGKLVLLDFNSGDAWLRAASLGAYGAILIEPEETTVFQADAKYDAILPLNFPRMYVRRADGLRLRKALADGRDGLRVTLVNRLRFENVRAGAIELTIPGKSRDRCFVLAAHVDARCIVPDLSYGAAEVWGVGELIELTRYFAQRQPQCDMRIIFTSGHWQSQRVMRDRIAYDESRPDEFDDLGDYVKLAMGVDMVPEGRSINLITESAWDHQSIAMYNWLATQLFRSQGWRDQILEELDLADKGVELFGGVRPVRSETLDDVGFPRNDRSPLIYAPRYPTAEEPWQVLGVPTFAFQTGRLARLAHNTPLDRLTPDDLSAADERLRPQLQISLAVLDRLEHYPAELLPKPTPNLRGGRGWGGYVRLRGHVQRLDKTTGWFSTELPEEGGRKLRTFVQAYPIDSGSRLRLGSRLRNYLHWPMCPGRGQHREMQSFMFQDLLLLDTPHYQIKTAYSGNPGTQYNLAAYALDEAGRIRFATDYGIHGDGNKSFQCTDLDVDHWSMTVPISLFECGTLELFDLVDPQRYNPSAQVRGTWFQTYETREEGADPGVAPYLQVTGVKDVSSHTDLDRWGFSQHGPTAMVFLPAENPTGVEVLLGSWRTNFAVLNDPDENGMGRGYRLAGGQTVRLTSSQQPTALACVRQLTALNQKRTREFAAYDVYSPVAQEHHQDSVDAVEAGEQARQRRDWQSSLAEDTRAWIFESLAYHKTVALLLDVVSTTVLYFVLLIPFSFLIERLVFPQRTILRTAVVAVATFAAFAGILYLFHPGFKLAHNVIVTVTAFVIVVMTIPALILLLVRGVAMLRAIGSKAVITQQSEAEGAGVVMASLSLAVSNMRRRRLRTVLTLLTITTLVVALVLLTTSSAFDFKIIEPSDVVGAAVEGLEIFNATDRRHPLLTETVELYEAHLRDRAMVVRRECVNYGYDPKSSNGSILLTAGERSAPLPYFQVMDKRDDLVVYRTVVPLGRVPVGIPPKQLLDSLKAGKLAPDPLLAYAVDHPDLTRQDLLGFLTGPDGLGGQVRLHDPAGQVRFDRRQAAGDVAGLGTVTFEEHRAILTLRLSDLMAEGEFLSVGDRDVCLLPRSMAEELGVKVGDTVTVMGLPLTVKGIWVDQVSRVQRDADGKETQVTLPGFLDGLTDLDGQSILAMRSAKFREGEPENPEHAPSREVVIVPRERIRHYRIFPSNVFALLVVPGGEAGRPEEASVSALAEELAKEIINVDIFTQSFTPGLRLDAEDPGRLAGFGQTISMQKATHVKGSSMMLVVLGAAVLLILAIMTGTVYERMREIHIFSSVGLSPRQIAGMFLIEALVYAGIAAVLGYFLGIIALKALVAYLKATGQYQAFYPNYLGVFVLYSIGIAVLATVASSLYPIRLASKVANPQSGKTWKLDEASSDDAWRIRLPFIATTWEEAKAMMVYAHDYLAIHQGERSGRFVCERPPTGALEGRTITLAMPVWLAPFERNLSQRAILRAAPAEGASWWVLSLELLRTSGPPYLWKRGATVFVNMLCKHLLRWRAASAQQEAQCAARVEKVFPAAT